MTDDMHEHIPALRMWQEKVQDAGPFQVPEYEDFVAIVQEHETLVARLAEVGRERDEALARLVEVYDEVADDMHFHAFSHEEWTRHGQSVRAAFSAHFRAKATAIRNLEDETDE